MGWFRKRKEKAPMRPPAIDPLLAVVHPDPMAELRTDADGNLQIRRELPERPGVSEFMARALGLRRAVRVNLDERGTYFWHQVDGQRNLGEIERRICRHYGVDERDSETAVMMYTKALLLRHLIHLELPQVSHEEQSDG
jgi:hypothetical protein